MDTSDCNLLAFSKIYRRREEILASAFELRVSFPCEGQFQFFDSTFHNLLEFSSESFPKKTAPRALSFIRW